MIFILNNGITFFEFFYIIVSTVSRFKASNRQKHGSRPGKNATEGSDFSETEVSDVEEREFAICYRKLIQHYRLTPEENRRQLDKILRCLGPPDGEESPEEVKSKN